jgi:hypothetical protein
MSRIVTLTGCLFAFLMAACGGNQDISGGGVDTGRGGSAADGGFHVFTDAAVSDADASGDAGNDADAAEAGNDAAVGSDASDFCQPPAHPSLMTDAGEPCSIDVSWLSASQRTGPIDLRLLGCASGDVVVVAFLESTADCGAKGGVAFDDHDPPTRIVFCPVTCALASECFGGIELLFGCSGVPK